MWRLFILPFAVVGAVGGLMGLVNGTSILVITLTADQWQRRRGHRPGEGIFTDREGGHVFGLQVASQTTDLGEFLAAMALAFPDLMGKFLDKAFDLTESEGELLRKMVQVAEDPLDDYHEVVGMMQANPDNIALLNEVSYRQDRLRTALVPVAEYLDSVPASRVKEAS